MCVLLFYEWSVSPFSVCLVFEKFIFKWMVTTVNPWFGIGIVDDNRILPCCQYLLLVFPIIVEKIIPKISGKATLHLNYPLTDKQYEVSEEVLSELKDESVNMFTTVFIGNSRSKLIGDKLVTPRGYRINE